MRILSLSTVFPNPHDRGHGLFVRARLEEIARTGPEIRVVAPVPMVDYSAAGSRLSRSRRIPTEARDGSLSILHPRWIYLPGGFACNAILLYRQLAGPIARLRRSFPFDVIDSHFAYPEGIAAGLLASRFGVPYSITLRGNETMHAGYSGRKWLMRRALSRAGAVISVSASLQRFALSMGADPSRCVTIPNGIDTGIFYPRDRQQARRKFGAVAGETVVASVGSLIERKGHHLIIDALARLRRENRPATLWIAGSAGREGHFADQLAAQIDRLGMSQNVRLLGQIDQQTLPELLSAADLFCLASSREGWPNAVHEALGCGTPVVATDVGGIPDMIPSERYGLIVPPGNPDLLYQALSRALSTQWDRDAIAAWGAARSWKQVAAEHLQALQNMIPKAAATA